MLAAIQSYFGEGVVLLIVIDACLLADPQSAAATSSRRLRLRRRLRGLRHDGNLSQ